MSEQRKDQFKEGIRNKTRDREVRATETRRDKRDGILHQRRRGGPVTLEAGAARTMQVAMRQYNIQNLLYQQDMQQLQLLSAMLSMSARTLDDRVEFDKHARKILCVDAEGDGQWEVLQLLIQLCGNANVEMRNVAIACLLNVTAIESQEHDLLIVKHLKKYGVLQMVYAWSANNKGDQLGAAYDVLANCLIACNGFVSDIMQCPLLCFYTDETVYNAAEAAASPMMRALVENTNVPNMQFFVHIMLESMIVSNYTVPWHFMLGVWPSLIRTMHWSLNAGTMDALDVEQRIAISSAIGTVMYIIRILNRSDRERILELLKITGLNEFFNQVSQWMQRADRRTAGYLCDICKELSELPMEDYAIQKSMAQTHCTSAMIRNLNHSVKSIRANAFVWLGNYMIGNFECVVEMLQPSSPGCNVLNDILQKIKRDVHDVRCTAVYALMSIFITCDETRRADMSKRDFAEGIMRTLVVVNKMFTWLGDFLDVAGDPTMMVDILRVISSALKWNKTQVLQELEDYGVMDRVALLVHHKDPVVYAHTSEIMELVDNHSQYAEERSNSAATLTMDMGPDSYGSVFNF